MQKTSTSLHCSCMIIISKSSRCFIFMAVYGWCLYIIFIYFSPLYSLTYLIYIYCIFKKNSKTLIRLLAFWLRVGWKDQCHCHVCQMDALETAILALSNGNKIPLPAPLNLTNYHFRSCLFNLYKSQSVKMKKTILHLHLLCFFVLGSCQANSGDFRKLLFSAKK